MLTTRSVSYEPPSLSGPDRYVVSGVLAETDRSTIFLARDQAGERDIVIKRFRESDGAAYLREAALGFEFEHPNVLVCSDTFYSDRVPCLVFDYAPGGTLRGVMERHGVLGFEEALGVIQQILSGLAHVHYFGRIHCDIKPENIFVVHGDDGEMNYRIGDMGASCYIVEAASGVYTPGTPAYRAPERIYQQFDENSDLYSLGVIAYELVVGAPPFSGSVEEISNAHLGGKIDYAPIDDIDYVEFVAKLLSRQPQRRFATAMEALFVSKGIKETVLPKSPASRFSFEHAEFCVPLSYGDRPRKISIDVRPGGASVVVGYEHFAECIEVASSTRIKRLPSFLEFQMSGECVYYVGGAGLVCCSVESGSKEVLIDDCSKARAFDLLDSRVAWVDDYRVVMENDGKPCFSVETRVTNQNIFRRLVKLRGTEGLVVSSGSLNEEIAEFRDDGSCCFRERLPDSIVDMYLGEAVDFLISLRTDRGTGYALWERKSGTPCVRRTVPEPFCHWAMDAGRLYLLMESGRVVVVTEQGFATVGKLTSEALSFTVGNGGLWLATVTRNSDGAFQVNVTRSNGIEDVAPFHQRSQGLS